MFDFEKGSSQTLTPSIYHQSSRLVDLFEASRDRRMTKICRRETKGRLEACSLRICR